jgi:hypothetical protein
LPEEECSREIGERGHENFEEPTLATSPALHPSWVLPYSVGSLSIHSALIKFKTQSDGSVAPEEIARGCRGYLKRWGGKTKGK